MLNPQEKKNGNLLYLPYTLLLIIGLFSCSGKSDTKVNPSASPQSDTDSHLTFYGVDLEQFDEVGRPIWKVRAKQAKYTKEKEIAQAQSPDGELYQDGKIVYRIKAQKADIQQNGKQLLLRGNILATDPINGVILHGQELEWLPQKDLLIVRNHFNGTHKQLQAVADEARVKTRAHYAEFFGHVVANSADPRLQIRTEHLIWQIQAQKLIGDRPVQIDNYKNNQVVNRAKGNATEVDLKTKIATLKQKAQLVLLDPPMQITSDSITWNTKTQIVNSDAPVRVYHQVDHITVTGNRGRLFIPQNTAYLTGNVDAIGERHQSLKSNNLTWYLNKKLLEAQGNVIYHQVDPLLNFTGETATGNLQNEHILVNGRNTPNRVVTVIIPQQVGQKK
jgi:LPS export ABC transporter protein LptC